MNSKFEIFNTDCLAKLAELPDSSIDLCLTDPPYGTTNLAFDKLKIDWQAWWTQIHRVCRPTAIIAVFSAQPFTTDLINSNRKNFRYEQIWQKTCAVGFLSANVRPLRAHENIEIFCQKFGRSGGPGAAKMQSVYNPVFEEGAPYVHKSRARPAAHYSATKDIGTYKNEGKRYPTSVMKFGRDTPSYHPTAKPVDLLRKLVKMYSHPGARVLDPFMGGGSSGVAALLEGREFVGIELDANYFATAKTRLEEVASR